MTTFTIASLPLSGRQTSLRAFTSAKLILIAVLTACDPAPRQPLPVEKVDERPAEPISNTASVGMPISLQWDFDPTEAETATIRDLLKAFVAQGKVPVARFGIIDRFNASGASGRYLLLTTSAGTSNGDAVVYVLQREHPQVSESLSIGKWGIETWGPTRLGDFDNDSLMDIAYCEWDEDNPVGHLRAAGFKNGAWYSITEVDTKTLDCAGNALDHHGSG